MNWIARRGIGEPGAHRQRELKAFKLESFQLWGSKGWGVWVKVQFFSPFPTHPSWKLSRKAENETLLLQILGIQFPIVIVSKSAYPIETTK